MGIRSYWGALSGSPATTAPNGDHLLLDGNKPINKSPSGVGGSGVSSSSAGLGGGVLSTIASRYSIISAVCEESFAVKRRRLQHTCFPANNCTSLNKDEVDTVPPPPRDDVPLLATRAAPVFAECDSVLNGSVSATRLTSNSDVTHIPTTLFPVSSFVTVSPGLGATNALGSPSTWTNSTASLGLNSTPTVCSFPIGFHPGDERGDARSPDARDAPVPSWLNRLFHPPER